LGDLAVTIFDSAKLLSNAISGDKEALGPLLDHFRPYLIVIAHRQLDERLRGRLDPMDVVQTTFLEAHRDFPSFRGTDINTLLAWLRNILHNNIETTHQRHLTALKRSAKRETNARIPSASPDGDPIVNWIPSESSSPSQRAMKDEAAASLAICLTQLPNTQSEAIRLRYLEGLSLRDIAIKLEKTEMAVAGLLKRGLKSLRSDLAAYQSSAEARSIS
jgi:RNA polymerase sigma-70 factor, ECF subfamily